MLWLLCFCSVEHRFSEPDTLAKYAIEQFAHGVLGASRDHPYLLCLRVYRRPQFLLIGRNSGRLWAILWGAVWAWVAATLFSGTITFWLGRIFSEATLRRPCSAKGGSSGSPSSSPAMPSRERDCAQRSDRTVYTGEHGVSVRLARISALHSAAWRSASSPRSRLVTRYGLQAMMQGALEGLFWTARAAIAALSLAASSMCGTDAAKGKILRSAQISLLTLLPPNSIAMVMRKNLPLLSLLLLTGPWPVAAVH